MTQCTPDSWCIDKTRLDLQGTDLTLPQADYDGDGAIEPVITELTDLAGHQVSARIENGVMVSLNELDFTVTATSRTPPDNGDHGRQEK